MWMQLLYFYQWSNVSIDFVLVVYTQAVDDLAIKDTDGGLPQTVDGLAIDDTGVIKSKTGQGKILWSLSVDGQTLWEKDRSETTTTKVAVPTLRSRYETFTLPVTTFDPRDATDLELGEYGDNTVAWGTAKGVPQRGRTVTAAKSIHGATWLPGNTSCGMDVNCTSKHNVIYSKQFNYCKYVSQNNAAMPGFTM